ncbi:phage portal protein [Streptomyces sp. NPDC050507]|uniref:phage portal protein n=1 Tax=Streptomyces sp. NPDC050507 TaxID=3365619 RepID=UPI00379DC269
MQRRAWTPAQSAADWIEDRSPWDASASTHAGKEVGRSSSLALPAVYYCVSLIADSIAALPVDVYEGTGRNRKAAQAPSWVRSPNAFMTAFDFWHRVCTSLLMDGNAFILTLRNGAGDVVSLLPLDPRMVTIQVAPDGSDVTFLTMGQTLDRSQMLWIPGYTVPGMARGVSPLDLARQAVGLGQVAEEFGARFFGQGTALSGVITHPGMPNPDQAAILAKMFRRNHAGTRNSHAVGILTGGAQWQSISPTPEQSQFLETRRFQKTEIALMYRVPAHLVDPTVTSSWGSGVEEQNKWFIDQTLTPWLVRIEQAVSTFLLPGGRYMKFNLDSRLRAKTSERYASYAVGIQNGFMNADQVAELEDWEPLPDRLGARYYRPANLIAVSHEDKAEATTKEDAGTEGDPNSIE